MRKSSFDFGRFNLKPDRILCNNIVFPWEFNPNNARLWIIGNEYGAVGAVWADCESDAIDELIDAGLGDGIRIDEEDADEDTLRAGNYGDPIDSEHLWIEAHKFDKVRDFDLLMAFAEARGACQDTLDK